MNNGILKKGEFLIGPLRCASSLRYILFPPSVVASSSSSLKGTYPSCSSFLSQEVRSGMGILFIFLSSVNFVYADQESLLKDKNGDQTVSILAFGDSLTYGIGDGLAPGAVVEEPSRESSPGGYPKRLQTLLGVKVTNSGVPGEQLVADGSDRFVRALRSSSADIALIMAGSNDANLQVSLSSYRNSLQRVINAASALGRLPVLLTIPPPGGNKLPLRPFTDSFTREQERAAFFNQLPLADIARAFKTTCKNINNCELLNLPEGLHPNSLGYDVMAQTVSATLYGIDIFSENGATDLAVALGVSPSEIKVLPDLAGVTKSAALSELGNY